MITRIYTGGGKRNAKQYNNSLINAVIWMYKWKKADFSNVISSMQ